MSIRLPRLLAVPAVAAVIALAACAPADQAPQPTADATPTPTPSATPEPIAFHADGTADDNRAIFLETVEQVWSSERSAEGRAYVDALVETGFDKSQMQVSKDLSTVGNPAETMMVSVRWSDSACLVGQFGPDTPSPVAKVFEPLDGVCIPGETRAIDW
ncbi:hypothetical protein [Microbacterium sp. G2-8]|uniref:DUF6993 domain-containing protein n=1 Tax=Microbacterium sp. G2-8 TaxID=2842454 RepID=UPI0027E2B6B1|nr:hypothetical protein [Microbacterium sp. G2-8]